MDTFSPFLIGFLIGVIVGILSHSYLKDGQANNSTSFNTTDVDLPSIIAAQIQYQQTQNMLRQMQLDQARQESEFRQLEQERIKHLGLAQKPDYAQIVATVSRELERQRGG